LLFVTAGRLGKWAILGYNEVTMSNHRPLYADIDLSRYLGGEPSALESRTASSIVSSDPRAVKVYRSQLEACLDHSALEEEMDKLLESIASNDGKMSSKHWREANRLEAALTIMKQTSERQCARIQSYPWSPKLREARVRSCYWHMAHTQLKVEVDLRSKMDRLDPEGQFDKEAREDKKRMEAERERKKKETHGIADRPENDGKGTEQQRSQQPVESPRPVGPDEQQKGRNHTRDGAVPNATSTESNKESH
jgi:hypothetical protein